MTTMLSRMLSTRDLPPVVQLKPLLDPARLLADLDTIERTPWMPEQPYKPNEFFGMETRVYHDGKWVGLSLRAQGGKADRTDPGGPGLEEFSDTPLLQRTPYLRQALSALNCPIRSARLSRLRPGCVIGEHQDTYHGFEYGQLRIHAPITTNDRVDHVIRGQQFHWQPGAFWYGDYGSRHFAANHGDTDRVHLLVDIMITPTTFDLFPDEFARQARLTDVLFFEEPVALDDRELESLQCSFRLPSTLVRGIFDIDDGIAPELEARIARHHNELVFVVDGKNMFTLVPLRNNRLRFAGWTTERCLRYERDERGVRDLSLVLSRGHQQTRISFVVDRPAS